MQHWWWWFMLTRIVLCKEEIANDVTEYKFHDYLFNLPSTNSDDPDTDNWKERSIFDLQEEDIPNHDSSENKRSTQYVNDEIPKTHVFPKWGVQQHFEFPYSDTKQFFKFQTHNKDYVLSNKDLHFPEIEIKRIKPAFSSWGGKRSPAFSSWGGKRYPSFSSWGGKRSPAFSSWGGKRYISSYLSEQQPILLQGWDQKHATNSSTINSNNPLYTGKESEEKNMSDMLHHTHNVEDKQTFTPNWDSKEEPSFSSWNGRVFTSADEGNINMFPNMEYTENIPENSEVTDNKDTNYKLHEGIITSDDHPILAGKCANTFSNENLLLPTSGGKRMPAFSSWGGKRAVAFSSWGGKRAPVFSSWGGKRMPAFSSWGGKRQAEDIDTSINTYNNHLELPVVNYDSEQAPAVSPNIPQPLELDGKRSDIYPFVKVKLYPAFSSTGGKRGNLVANHINKHSIQTFTNLDNKRNPILSSWYSNTVQTLPKSGKRRPVFSSWGGKRSLGIATNIENPLTRSGEKKILHDHLIYKRAADTEEYSIKHNNGINDETKFLKQIMKQLNHESRKSEIYLPKAVSLKEKKDCITNKNLLDLSKGIISMCGMKRTQVGETKRVFQKMLLRGSGFKDITWPTIRSNSRGADFYAWGGKRSFSR